MNVTTSARDVRLVIADVDGTLLTPDKLLTPRARAAVEAVTKAGIAFTITSGRPPRGMKMLIDDLHLQSPITAFNGGLLLQPDLSVIQEQAIPSEAIPQVVDILTRHALDVWSYTEDPGVPREPDELVISFADGAPVAIDGRPLSPLAIITELNARAGAQGVGRVDMVEDRLVGIKSREIYEAPGAIALIAAHSELESVCMELDLSRFKRAAEQRWTELVYDGLWYSPLKSALDAFLNQAARHVTGDIRLRLHGGQAVVTGRRSPVSLYDFGLATYDTGDTFDQRLAKGFVELWGLPSKTAALREQRAAR